MSPKRPPRIVPVPVTKEWDPTDTQTLERRIDLAQETEWRRSTVDQIKAIAETLKEVRDTAREAKASLEFKAAKSEVATIDTKVQLIKRDLWWMAALAGPGATMILDFIAKKMGIL
jgi:hypothetical protein